MAKLKKRSSNIPRPSSSTTTTPKAASPAPSLGPSSPISIRSAAPVPTTTTSAHITGEVTTDNGSIRSGVGGLNRPRSTRSVSTSSSLTTANGVAIPASASFTPPAAASSSPDSSPQSTTSALSLLRQKLSNDETARKTEQEGPKKLRKVRRPELSEDTFRQDGEVDEEAEELNEVEETVQQDDVPTVEELASGMVGTKVLVEAEPGDVAQTYSVLGLPSLATSYALALPRYSLGLAQRTIDFGLDTSKAVILLPLHTAQRLPLVGPLLSPSPSSQEAAPSTVTFAPDPKTTRFDSIPDTENHGYAWKAAEFGLGVTLAGVLVAGAGASWAWDSVRGNAKGKGKGRA